MIALITNAAAQKQSPQPLALTVAREGTVWYLDISRQVIASVDATGRVTEHPLSAMTKPGQAGMRINPNGNIWFFDASTLGEMTPNARSYTKTFPGYAFSNMATGPDGTAWFTAIGTRETNRRGSIVRVSPRWAISRYPLDRSMEPRAIAIAPDGAVWFTETVAGTYAGGIVKLTPSGHMLTIASLHERPAGIAFGYGGDIWFTSSDGIRRISQVGVVTPIASNGSLSFSDVLKTAPDGTVWFTAQDGMGTTYRLGHFATTGLITALSVRAELPDFAFSPNGGVYFIERFKIAGVMPDGRIVRYSLPGTPPPESFSKEHPWLVFTIVLLGILVLPNIDWLFVGAFATGLVRLNSEQRKRLTDRLPFGSLPLATLIVCGNVDLLAFLGAIAVTRQNGISIAAIIFGAAYFLVGGVALIYAIAAKHAEPAIRRIIASFGFLSGGLVLAIMGLSAAAVSGDMLPVLFEFGLIVAVPVVLAIRLYRGARPEPDFSKATILSSGFLNGGLIAVVLLALAAATEHAEAQMGFFSLIPFAMLWFYGRGVLAGYLVTTLRNRRRSRNQDSLAHREIVTSSRPL